MVIVRARYAYSAVIVLMASAWLVGHLFKPGDRSPLRLAEPGLGHVLGPHGLSPLPPTELALAPIVTDPARLGIADTNNWPPGGKCNIERLNNVPFGNEVPVAHAKSPVRFSGWALDPATSRMPRSLLLQFMGEGGIRFFVAPEKRFPRDDVTDYFKLPRSAALSGFEFQSESLNLPAGEYALR